MNWVDVLIIIALGVTTFFGFKWGLIKTVVPLAGLILAIVLAGALHSTLADQLDFIDSESWAKIVAFGIIFAIVFIAVYVIASIIKKIASITFLGWVDKLGGAALGFVVGWLICSVIVVMVARYAALPPDVSNEPDPSFQGTVQEWLHLKGLRKSAYNTIDGSALATFQIDTFPVILGLLPSDFDPVKDFFGN